MVKAYLRYELAGSWGVLCSNSNLTYDRTGRWLVTSSLENVSLWNPKQGTLVSRAACAGGSAGAAGQGAAGRERWSGAGHCVAGGALPCKRKPAAAPPDWPSPPSGSASCSRPALVGAGSGLCPPHSRSYQG